MGTVQEAQDCKFKLKQIAAISARLLQDGKGDFKHFEDLLALANDESVKVLSSASEKAKLMHE